MFYELKSLIENLIFNDVLVHSKTGDGRLDSAESEPVLIQALHNHFDSNPDCQIKDMPARHWCDIEIYYKNQYFPINIKITSGKGADNLSSKEGMFYALTEIKPDQITGLNRWDSYNTNLLKHLKPNNNADYYFLVYFKDTNKILFTSLKRIETLTPNGNNLPFQCNWSKNLIETTRSRKEQENYILNSFIDSYIKKAAGLETLLKWRNENEC